MYSKLSGTINAPLHWIIIPIETKVREFDAKLLLGCAAAEAGYGVIIGHQHVIRRNWRKMPRGVVFDKSVVKANKKKFSDYKRKGNGVIAWCEEGLLVADKRDYLNRKIYAPTLHDVDLFLAWGENQASIVLEKVPEIKDKMELFGNPRMDLLRKELRGYFFDEAEKLKKNYGPFLLINTNFAPYNNIRGTETALEIQKRSGKIRSIEGERLFREFVQFKKDMYYAFISMAGSLANAFTDYTVVIRPHPAENHTNWLNATAHYPNIQVIHEGNVINWILAAEVTIQNGCTTGIESFLLDKPTISFQPFESGIYENYLPDVLGMQVAGEKELVDLIKAVCAGNVCKSSENDQEKRMIAKRFIHNIDGPLCIDRIVAHLSVHNRKKDVLVGSGFLQTKRNMANWPTSIRYFLRAIKDRIVSGENMGIKEGSQKSLAAMQNKVVKQVFPGLEFSEIKYCIHRLQQVTNRFTDLRVFPYYKNCFAIMPGMRKK